MSALLAEALEKIQSLPLEEQDRVATQILAELAEEHEWSERFAEKRDVIRRMADEALAEDAKGDTLPLSDAF